jgi:hypothetical protein
MEIDILPIERALPVYVISVRLAATIYAYELGEWNGKTFDDTELDPFLQPIVEGVSERATTRTHGWEALELRGPPLQARQSIESLICRDIDSGRLSALHLRRDFEGALIPTETLLDVDKVRDWGETYKFDHGDWWREYADDEGDIAEQALSAIKEGWEQLLDPKRLEGRKQRARALDDGAILEILHENERLRAVTHAPDERPLDRRTRASLLCIIGALAEQANLDLSQPMKAGDAIEKMLPGDVRLSGRTIGEHLKAVRVAMDSRKG